MFTIILSTISFIIAGLVYAVYPDDVYLPTHVAAVATSLGCFFIFVYLVFPSTAENAKLLGDVFAGKNLRRNRHATAVAGVLSASMFSKVDALCCDQRFYFNPCIYFDDGSNYCEVVNKTFTNPFERHALLRDESGTCELSPDCNVTPLRTTVLVFVSIVALIVYITARLTKPCTTVQRSVERSEGPLKVTDYSYFSFTRFLTFLFIFGASCLLFVYVYIPGVMAHDSSTNARTSLVVVALYLMPKKYKSITLLAAVVVLLTGAYAQDGTSIESTGSGTDSSSPLPPGTTYLYENGTDTAWENEYTTYSCKMRDEFEFALTTYFQADCYPESHNPYGDRYDLELSENFRQTVDSGCYSQNTILAVRKGHTLCTFSGGRLEYDARNINNIPLAAPPRGPSRYYIHPTSTTRRSRREVVVANLESTGYTYYLPQGFVTATHLRKDFRITCTSNPGDKQYSGKVPTYEGVADERYCSYTSSDTAWRNYVCTSDRRDIISCNKGYIAWCDYMASVVYCIPISETESAIYTYPTLNAFENSLGLTARDGRLAGVREPRKYDIYFLGSSLSVDLSYLEASQDNDQSAGQDKYFVYAAVATVTTRNGDFPALYYQYIAQNSDLGNSAETYDHYNAVEMCKYLTVDQFNARGGVRILKYTNVQTANRCVNRQDSVYASVVYKSDIINSEGEFYDPATYSQIGAPTFSHPDKDGFHRFTIPMYYAARLYGPIVAEFPFLGNYLERVYMTNVDSDCPSCLKIRGTYYEPDMDHISTDITVTGYPLTALTSYSSLRTSTNTVCPEMLTFYLQHPKIGAAMYLAKVSTTASIGTYSAAGKCEHMQIDGDGKRTCEGYPAFEVPIVKYATYYKPRSVEVRCATLGNEYRCKSTLPVTSVSCLTSQHSGRTDCVTNTSHTHYSKLPNSHNFRMVIADNAHEQGHGQNKPNGEFPFIVEVYHRNTLAVIFFYLLINTGTLLLLFLFLLTVLCYFNGHNLVTFLHMMGLKNYCGDFMLRRCPYCGILLCSEIENQAHKATCSRNACSYCVRRIEENDRLTVNCRQYASRELFLKHMRKHKRANINPMLGLFTFNTTRVVAFAYTAYFVLVAQATATMTGLRNEHIGKNITLSPEYLKCTDLDCRVDGTLKLTLPFTRGAKFVLSTQHGGNSYSKDYEVTTASMATTCTYLYTSSGYYTDKSVTKIKCLGTIDCDKFTKDDLYQPVGGSGDQHIPFDTSNPLKTYYCPTSFDCVSPAEGWDVFKSLYYQACFAARTGVTTGYTTLLPKVFEPLLAVFECTVKNFNYTVCSSDNCKGVINDHSEITTDQVKFPTISSPLPITFRVGALVEQGKSTPLALYYDAPEPSVHDNAFYAFKMLDVPQGELCTQGTAGPDVDCRINSGDYAYQTRCRYRSMQLDVTRLDSELSALSTRLPCTSKASRVSWTTQRSDRTIRLGSKTYTDSQTTSRPSLQLVLDHCNLGYHDVLVDSTSNLRLQIEEFKGTIKSVVCEGAYNRNQFARLSLKMDSPGGLLNLDCGDGISPCLVHTDEENDCNVTVLLPHRYDCKYHNPTGLQTISVNCSSLSLIDPDFPSDFVIGPTGSSNVNTWPDVWKLLFTNPFGKIVSSIGAVILLLAIVFLLYFLYKFISIIVARIEQSRPLYNNDQYRQRKRK